MQKMFGLGVAALLLAGTVAQAQHVHTDYDHNAPFSDYHTFTIRKVQTVNPLDQSVLRDEIRSDLQYHGWREVPSGGDVAITVIGGQTEQKQ